MQISVLEPSCTDVFVILLGLLELRRHADSLPIGASHSCRLISRLDGGQRDHSHASHGAQVQAPGRGTTDTDQSYLNFDISGEPS